MYRKPPANIASSIKPRNVKAKLNYLLTPEQKKISQNLIEASKEIYVHAVCGAGKTEITFESIEKAIAKGFRVGIAIPRREVVKELLPRFQSAFPSLHVIAVYGGHVKELDGDIIILTTHQSYRYTKKFGLLIIDEYDAFPFYNDPALIAITKRCCYGKTIYLSATFTSYELAGNSKAELFKRFHGKRLPIPTIIKANLFISMIKIIPKLKEYANNQEPCFLFVPTIQMSQVIHKLLTIFNMNSVCFNSQITNKEKLFDEIKNHKYEVVVTTSILERGITMPSLQVIVLNADHPVFSYATLMQICGRVGRKAESPKGDILLFCFQSTNVANQVSKSIQDTNEKMLVM